MAQDRTGLLIIRLWTEPESSKPLRAVIRSTTDVSVPGFEHEMTLVSVDKVLETVAAWMLRVSATAESGDD